MDLQQQFNETLFAIRKQTNMVPEVGIVLGTGMGQLVDHIEVEKEVNYNYIPHFPVSTVESHHGRLIFGRLGGKNVVAMQGRFHYYEGYSMEQITYPVRIMKLLGVHTLLLSNAAGGLNPTYKKGDMMVLDDHINLLPENPLRGKNLDELGPRFPDMSAPYDKDLIAHAKAIASANQINVHSGVYVSVSGPNLETRAEYRYLRIIGADVVGMSTVPEVIVGVHMGMRIFAISVITDECDPDHLEPVKLEEIIAVAGRTEPKLALLLEQLVAGL
jgi:purine-nucleoside phosphorylase